jgi:predicted RNA binding protein YcfA (HicA-like mRNA interferase family)
MHSYAQYHSSHSFDFRSSSSSSEVNVAPKLPRVLWTDVFKALESLGFGLKKGASHQIMRHPDGRRVVLSVGSGEVPSGILREILRLAGLSVPEFIALLESRKSRKT